MPARRIVQVRFHEGADIIQLVVLEWPDELQEMTGPVIYGVRKSRLQYEVEVLVPHFDPERFDNDPFQQVVNNAESFVAAALQGDVNERRRRAAAGRPPGAVGPLSPAS